MSKHTPGPWTTNGTFVWPTNDEKRIREYGDIMAIEIPQNFTPDLEWTNGQRTANARLIAAAPELYEALRTLVTACVENGWPTKAEHTTPMIVARAALAKVDA